jgi:hypothetical protein
MNFTEQEHNIVADLVLEEYEKSAESKSEYPSYVQNLENILKKLDVPFELIAEMKSFNR